MSPDKVFYFFLTDFFFLQECSAFSLACRSPQVSVKLDTSALQDQQAQTPLTIRCIQVDCCICRVNLCLPPGIFFVIISTNQKPLFYYKLKSTNLHLHRKIIGNVKIYWMLKR